MKTIQWIDHQKEPRCPPDPNYPTGIDVDVAGDAERWCFTEVPYPARRCGMYVIDCQECGLCIGVTTAGRPDDPRSVKMACKKDVSAGACAGVPVTEQEDEEMQRLTR